MIRRWRDGDRDGIDALVDGKTRSLYRQKLHALHGPDRDADGGWKRTRVAVGPAGEVVGAVTVGRNRTHPGQCSLAVRVAAAHRGQGLGRELVAEGRRIRPEPLPLVTQVYGSDAAGTALLRSAGGEIVQTTPAYVLDPAALGPWCAAHPAPPGVMLDSLGTVAPDDLTAAFVDLYVWQHAGWAAPVSVPALTRHARGLVDVASPEASVGAWVGGRLAALSFAALEPPRGGVVAETVLRDEPDGAALVAAALAETLRRLAAAGAGPIELDGHVSDPHLHPVTLTFPPGLPAPPFHTVRLR